MLIKEGDFFRSRRGQVWVETVIYTLIALTIIGLFLSFAKPKIEEIQDKSVIDQSVEMLDGINSRIVNIVQGGVGNKRIININIKKGSLSIDGVGDQLTFELEGKYTYTEPGEDGAPGNYVDLGRVLATTKRKGGTSIVTLISNYSNSYDIQYQRGDNIKAINKAPITYEVSMEYTGDSSMGKPIINFEVI